MTESAAADVLEPTEQTEQTAGSLINGLPDEILGEIFLQTMHLFLEYACQESRTCSHWIFITSVCRRWHDVAVRFPALWSYLILPCDKACLALLLEWARDAPLHVVYTSHYIGLDTLQLVLKEHLHHIQTLSLDVSRVEYERSVRDELTRPAIHLRILEIEMRTGATLSPECDNIVPWKSLSSMATLRVLDVENRTFSSEGITMAALLGVLAGVPLLRRLQLHKFVVVLVGQLSTTSLKNLEECDLHSTPAACSALLQHIITPEDMRIWVEYHSLGDADHPLVLASIATKPSSVSSRLLSFAIFLSCRQRRNERGRRRRVEYVTLSGCKPLVGPERVLRMDDYDTCALSLFLEFVSRPPPLKDLLRSLSLHLVQHLQVSLDDIHKASFDLSALSDKMPNLTMVTCTQWQISLVLDSICNLHVAMSGGGLAWPALTTLVLQEVSFSSRPHSHYDVKCVMLLRAGLLRRQTGGCATLDHLFIRMSTIEGSDLRILEGCCREIICERNKSPVPEADTN
ncbi:hypothetical protein NM688_g5694 [Phlebia brevispora]|uniref:Uncharacterized protein n=1 Tax=Phlebia brevispora TaxID=194682 RepID=A0ACC1SRC3_9APHY|nr:hypothetical protein NM688_g5694 [Phlebia brevispora]